MLNGYLVQQHFSPLYVSYRSDMKHIMSAVLFLPTLKNKVKTRWQALIEGWKDALDQI
jgi:hypothetical protein